MTQIIKGQSVPSLQNASALAPTVQITKANQLTISTDDIAKKIDDSFINTREYSSTIGGDLHKAIDTTGKVVDSTIDIIGDGVELGVDGAGDALESLMIHGGKLFAEILRKSGHALEVSSEHLDGYNSFLKDMIGPLTKQVAEFEIKAADYVEKEGKEEGQSFNKKIDSWGKTANDKIDSWGRATEKEIDRFGEFAEKEAGKAENWFKNNVACKFNNSCSKQTPPLEAEQQTEANANNLYYSHDAAQHDILVA